MQTDTQRFTLVVPNNNDNGSLNVGNVLPNKVWAKGDKIQIEGEGDKIRTVTFVMGSGEKQHICFKGQGPLPKGSDVRFRLVTAETATATPPAEPSEADLEALTQPDAEQAA